MVERDLLQPSGTIDIGCYSPASLCGFFSLTWFLWPCLARGAFGLEMATQTLACSSRPCRSLQSGAGGPMVCTRRSTLAEAEGKRPAWSPVHICDYPAISIHTLNATVRTSKECPQSVYTAGLTRAEQSGTDYLPVRIVHTTAPLPRPV